MNKEELEKINTMIDNKTKQAYETRPPTPETKERLSLIDLKLNQMSANCQIHNSNNATMNERLDRTREDISEFKTQTKEFQYDVKKKLDEIVKKIEQISGKLSEKIENKASKDRLEMLEKKIKVLDEFKIKIIAYATVASLLVKYLIDYFKQIK